MNKPLTIKQAVEWIESQTGVRKSYPTLFRWMQKGVGGRRLPYICCGGSRHLQPETLAAFLEACTGTRINACSAADPVPAKPNPRHPLPSPERRRQVAENSEHLRRRLQRR